MDISDVGAKTQEVLQRSYWVFSSGTGRLRVNLRYVSFVSFLYTVQEHSGEKGWDLEVTFVPTCQFAFQIYVFPWWRILCHMETFSSSLEDRGAKSQVGFTGCLLNCNKSPWNSLKVAPLTRRKFQLIPLKTEHIARTANILVDCVFYWFTCSPGASQMCQRFSRINQE